MKRLSAVLATVGSALIVSLVFNACDQGTKKVNIRFKFQPEMRLEYQQITKGLVKVYDLDRDTLVTDEFAENTMDLEYLVRRILEDSTAEIIDTRKLHVVYRNRLDSLSADSVMEKSKEPTQLIRYVKPNGALIDMEFASDTARGNIDYYKEYYKQGWPVFPSGEVSQGHSWTQTTTVVLPDGPAEASTTYTVKSFARERGYDCVVIEYDGTLIIPLPGHSGEKYDVIGGVDHIVSKGHMYFAYQQGAVVLLKERWILDSERTKVFKVVDSTYGYGPGDTAHYNVAIEYDVDYSLQKLVIP
jgi:hypothetical protein